MYLFSLIDLFCFSYVFYNWFYLYFILFYYIYSCLGFVAGFIYFVICYFLLLLYIYGSNFSGWILCKKVVIKFLSLSLYCLKTVRYRKPRVASLDQALLWESGNVIIGMLKCIVVSLHTMQYMTNVHFLKYWFTEMYLYHI